MKGNRRWFLIVGLVILFTLIAACSGDTGTVVTDEPVVVAQPAVTDATVAEGEGTETADLGAYGQPVDVPIMDGNRDLRVSRTGENIGYTVDTVTVVDVYRFYRQGLDDAGWIAGPNEAEPEGRNFATLARGNDLGDRITVTMQGNNIGNFVVVTIVLVRAP